MPHTGFYAQSGMNNLNYFDMKDRCVLCGRETPYDYDTPIDMRIGYEPGSGQQCPFGCHKNSPKSLTDECDIDPDKVIHVEPIMISEAGDISLLIKTLKAIGITFAVLATWIICIAAIHYLYTQFINVVK
jgi:hypothetical protein